MVFPQSTDTPSDQLREFIKLNLSQNYDASQVVVKEDEEIGDEYEEDEYEDEDDEYEEDTPFPAVTTPPSRF